MPSTLSLLAASLAAATSVVSAFPFHLKETENCSEVNGTFSIDNYKLYPENLDWDPVHCKLYIRYCNLNHLHIPLHRYSMLILILFTTVPTLTPLSSSTILTQQHTTFSHLMELPVLTRIMSPALTTTRPLSRF